MAQVDSNLEPFQQECRGKKWAKDFILCLQGVRQYQSDLDICRSLFKAVSEEYLPLDIFAVFLSWSKCPDTIALCLRDGPLHYVRLQGIKHLYKALANAETWEPAWRALGGTEGLIHLFAKISVIEVKALARAIGCCNLHSQKVPGREKAIEELLQALLPSHYPKSKFRSHDKRHIQRHYRHMVSACSPEFVARLLDAKDQSNPLYQQVSATRLIKTHGELLENYVLEALFGDGDGYKDDYLPRYLEAFVYRRSQKTSSDPWLSASMAFATKVLQTRLVDIGDDKRWPASISEADILFSLLRRSLRKKLPDARLCNVITLGLQLLESKPMLKPKFQSNNFWFILVTRWKKTPKLYEDSLALSLHLELGGKTIGQDFLKTLRTSHVRPELRWPLFRLYCLHVPKKGVDLETSDDLQSLPMQQWPSDIFYELSQSHAVRLLKGLLDANTNEKFLLGPAEVSILSDREFNVSLLLTLLQRNSEEIQGIAENTVDELRKKASTKEQLERAGFAKAASAMAIASGNLELYGKTITWQQRFARDPPSVRLIFGRDAVLTREGIELLSGIPKPLPEDITVAEVASGVKKANEVLETLHETLCIAKREPSFYQPDWTAVTSLFSVAISQRVARARDLQKHLRCSEANVYTALWGDTLAMVEKINVGSLNQAYESIKTLLLTLPLTVLVAITKAILETGNEKRRNKQGHQLGDDTLERLSYDLLLRLAKSEMAQKAQPLILQTIIDRADASSWHRKLLSASFLNRLSAKDAHELLVALAAAIGDKLEEQSITIDQAQPRQSTSPRLLVKVTTVKYLSQLLNNAEFISADTAAEILVELFKVGTHRDIRLATLDSLLNLLNDICSKGDWRSNVLTEKVLGSLKIIIPVVGSVNERHPPLAENWEEARKSGILPNAYDVSAGIPPLLYAILTASDGKKYPGLKQLQGEFMQRFLLPILERSQAEHRKWIALFLSKHKAHFTVNDLPPTPITSLVWDILVNRYFELIPETVLEDFNKYLIMRIAPPVALKDFNNSLRLKSNGRNTLEVDHWLSVFGGKSIVTNGYHSSGTRILVSKINRDWPHSSTNNGITFNKVLDMVISHASLFLDKYENYTSIWNAFVNDLRRPQKRTYSLQDATSLRSTVSAWKRTGRVVLQKVVALIIARKNKEIQENKPSILPSGRVLRLWLLPYPCFPDPSETDHQCQIFVKELEELFNDFLKGETNVLRWPKIAKDAYTVSDSLNTAEEQLHVALYIGKLTGSLSGGARDQRSSALNLVRVTLAMKLIEDKRNELEKMGKDALSKQEKELARLLKERIEEWQSDFDEGIREKVADWKAARKDLWTILMNEDQQ